MESAEVIRRLRSDAPVTHPLTSGPVAHSHVLSYYVPNTQAKGLHIVGEFGDKFRKARERKELSLDDISNVTKISPRMLQAIEEEHFDQLPGGVFNRGFIRAYAKHLGLNSEDAVNDYLACLRQAQIDSHAGWDATQARAPHTPAPTNGGGLRNSKPVPKVEAPPAPQELPELQLPRIEHLRPAKKEYLGRPSSGIPWFRIVAAVCVLISGYFVWMRHSHRARISPTPSVSASAAQPAPLATTQATTAATTTPATTTSPQATAPAALAAPPPSPSQAPAKPAVSTPAPATRKPAPAPADAAVDANAVKVEKKGDVTVRSFGTETAKPSEKAKAAITLVVRARENSWISITSDGQLVTQETLIAPAATSFRATRELVVRVGNAAGVSFLWNGEEVPPQGAEAEAKTLIFDAQGMHTAAPQPTTQP